MRVLAAATAGLVLLGLGFSTTSPAVAESGPDCSRITDGQRAGRVVAWGWSRAEAVRVPDGLGDVVAVAAGNRHALALRSDGTVVAWGSNAAGQTAVPPDLGPVRAISASFHTSAALLRDGTVVVWGQGARSSAPPADLRDVVAVAAGSSHVLALLANGTVRAWGRNSSGQAEVPVGLADVVAIAAGGAQSYAVLRNGGVIAWGVDTATAERVPYFEGPRPTQLELQSRVALAPRNAAGYLGLNPVVQISTDYLRVVSVKPDGGVEASGLANDEAASVPPQIADRRDVCVADVGGGHNLLLTRDGQVLSWGPGGKANVSAQVPPTVRAASGIAAGGDFSLAIVPTARVEH